MTSTAQPQSSPWYSTTKSEARINRDKDTGWGYAWAHLLPFVSIYYAFTRRTITPVLANFVGSFAIAIIVAMAVAGEKNEDKKAEVIAQLLYLPAVPVLTKLGIDSARNEKNFGQPQTN